VPELGVDRAQDRFPRSLTLIRSFFAPLCPFAKVKRAVEDHVTDAKQQRASGEVGQEVT
jgi:hypothetical protein